MSDCKLWQEAARWLAEFRVLPEWQVTELGAGAGTGAGAAEGPGLMGLAHALRDGVLLCHLLHSIDAASVQMRDVSLRPQMAQFLCLKNIRVFLTSCSQFYHIDDADLFDPAMLFDYTDFGKVLRTLCVLSFTTNALSHGIKGFPRDKGKSASFEEQIYRQLGEKSNGSDVAAVSPLALGVSRNSAEENVYEHLCYVSLRQQSGFGALCSDLTAEIHPLDALRETCVDQRPNSNNYEDEYFELVYKEVTHGVSTSPASPSAKQPPPLEKRDYCVNELLETEANYLRVLKQMRFGFAEPLTPILSADDAAVIFSCVTELEQLHSALSAKFKQHSSSSSSSMSRGGSGVSGHHLASVFLSFKSCFLVYGEYCSNLQRAQRLLDRLCDSDDQLATKLAKCEQDVNNGRFKLRELMSVPMQRILKYELLLKELLKQSVKSVVHKADQLSLERAVAAMKDVAEYINEVKRDTETLQIIQDIENSISGLCFDETPFKSMQDCGRLLKDGEIKVKCHPENKLRLRYAFLFDDALILCKPTKIVGKMFWGEQYSFKRALLMRDYVVEELSPGGCSSVTGGSATSAVGGTGDARWSHQWNLVHRMQLSVFEMHAKNDSTRQQWLAAFQQAREHAEPPECCYTDHRFVLTTFAGAQECDTCLRLMKGVYRQGYRCARCHRRAHRPCIRASGMCGVLGAAKRSSDKSDICMVQLPRQRCSPSLLNAASTTRATHPPTRSSSMCIPSASASRLPSRSHSVLDVSRPLPEYVNLVLEDQLWWAGEMDRTGSETALQKRSPGTFLMRVSTKQDNNYVISLRSNERVTHMRVREEPLSDKLSNFSLSGARRFNSLIQLVQYYQLNSLRENFSGLNMKLCRPWKQEDRAVVKFRYTNHNNAANVLSLNVGEEVLIVSREGEQHGWLKGSIGDRTGYFPKSYVQEIL